MDTMLIDSTASSSTRTVRQNTSMSATATPYRHGYDIAQPSPTTSSLFNFKKWAEDGAHDNRRGHCSLDEEDAFTYTKRWNACPFDADAYSDEPGRFTEWVYQPDEMGRHHHQHPYYDVPESMVASSSSTSVWCHSGVASTASTSVDSLGLHHVTLGSPSAESSPPPPPLSAASAVSVISAPPGPDSPAGTGGPVYDKTNFATASDSIWTQHELSELDIMPIPPSSGTLVNWTSPLASWCAMDEEEDIERLLGQKRPRDAELDEFVERYKRRRTLPDLWVQV